MARGSSPKVLLGIVSRPNGLRGAVVAGVHPSMLDCLAKGLPVELSPKAAPPFVATLTSAAPIRGGARLTFDTVRDRNASEALVGAELRVERSALRGLGEDEYLEEDLLGLEVVADDGTPLGRVAEVIATGANDVYVVRADDGREVLVPAVSHALLGIDLDAGRMTVLAEALEYTQPPEAK